MGGGGGLIFNLSYIIFRTHVNVQGGLDIQSVHTARGVSVVH